MELRGLKINMKKTKSMVTGNKARERIQAREGWEQTLCFVLNVVSQTMLGFEKSVRGAELCTCPRCAREGEGGDDNGNDKGPGFVANGGMLEEVEQLCYLGNVLDCETGVERAV